MCGKHGSGFVLVRCDPLAPDALDPVAAHRPSCHLRSPQQKPYPAERVVAGEKSRREAHPRNGAPSCVMSRLLPSPSTLSLALGANVARCPIRDVGSRPDWCFCSARLTRVDVDL
ncbi:hypothetical protein MTO96_036979 [Rhipicephalus appendiculatus]